LRKKEGRRTYQGWYRAFIIGALVIDCHKASPSFWLDHDRGGGCGTRTSSSSIETVIAGPYGTSSSDRTTTGGAVVGLECPLLVAAPQQRGPTGLGPPFPLVGPQQSRGCNSETSSSPMRVMPNCSFIDSKSFAKKPQCTQIVSFSRERAQHF
jgi:hypothetical protein